MHENSTLGILDVVQIVVERWYILLIAPLAVLAFAYFAVPSAAPTFSGTASLATNQHPTSMVMDKAFSAGRKAGLPVTIQETGVQITATTSATSEEKVRAALEAAMAPFLTAKVVQDDRAPLWTAAKKRLTSQIEVLQNALDTLTSNPPRAATADYNPSSYANSVLTLSSKVTELSEKLFDMERQNTLALAVSGMVSYDFQVQRSNSRTVLMTILGLTTLVVTLLCLVALEALRRRSTVSRA